MAMTSAIIDVVDARSSFVRAFVGAAATVILGVLVAFVSGAMGKLDKISSIALAQEAQSTQIASLRETMDMREKANRLAELSGVKEEGVLNVRIATILAQHDLLLSELRSLRSDLATARKGK
jgi:hypothetical protein